MTSDQAPNYLNKKFDGSWEQEKVSMTTEPKTKPKAVGNWIVMKPLKPFKVALTPHCLSCFVRWDGLNGHATCKERIL